MCYNGFMKTRDKVILSLFDYSGAWCQPYADAGYQVIAIDQQIEGIDVADFSVEFISEELDFPPFVHGILAAPPCTAFAASGAQYWPAKDEDGRTNQGLDLVRKTLATVEYYTVTDQDVIDDGYPWLAWWVLENPAGRLNRLVDGLDEFGPWYFDPCDYGDPWTKKTGLWGEFNHNLVRDPVEPIPNFIRDMKGTGAERQAARSKTPSGFIRAFFNANP